MQTFFCGTGGEVKLLLSQLCFPLFTPTLAREEALILGVRVAFWLR